MAIAHLLMGRRGRPLHARHFICIADEGFGDPQNFLAHSMAWFQGRLYVGTTRMGKRSNDRTNPGMFHRRSSRPGAHAYIHEPSQRGQIWVYNPQTDRWQKTYESPVIRLPDGTRAPREIGYRSMVVFQGASDSAPALYVSSISNVGSLILRSDDGEHFVPVSQRGLENNDIWSLRTLVPFRGRLYTSPTGRIGAELIDRNIAETPIVLEGPDPAAASWKQVSEIGFGDPTNRGIFEMALFNGFLYAGTGNPYTGFQIWKTRAEVSPYQWQKVITDGAFRGNSNEAIVSMYVFNDALYVGTGIQGMGYDRAYNAGPAAAELLRIHPDDSWELIVGSRRRTFEGVKTPLSGLGPGFGNKFNSVIWRMIEHDGWLYVGTEDLCSYLLPITRIAHIRSQAIDDLVDEEGGFDLWRSQDGAVWELVTRVGFGNPHNHGLRTFASTPIGLFVGTTGLHGCEIWLGRRS